MQYKHATFLLLLIAMGTAILTVAVFERRTAIEESQETVYSKTGAVSEDIDQYLFDLNTKTLGSDEYRQADVDLDGDGKTEHVALSFGGNRTDGYTTTITINGQSKVIESFGNPEGYFGIVDLDIKDPHKEIAVSDDGPSSDYTTAFFAWNEAGAGLNDLGITSDRWESMRINGDRTLVAEKRAMV